MNRFHPRRNRAQHPFLCSCPAQESGLRRGGDPDHGLGIGANTAVFSVVDGVLLKPSLIASRNGWCRSECRTGHGRSDRGNGLGLSTGITSPIPNRIALSRIWGSGIPHGSRQQRGGRSGTSALHCGWSGRSGGSGVPPELGRWFSADDQKPGAAPTILLSHGYWQERFGGQADVIGRTMMVDAPTPVCHRRDAEIVSHRRSSRRHHRTPATDRSRVSCPGSF